MRTRITVVVVVALGATLFAPGAARADLASLRDYGVAHYEVVAPGVEHRTLRRSDVPQAVNILRILASAPIELRAVAADTSTGRTRQRTSAMCARVSCLAAVNGDFFASWSGRASGGVVSGGELVQSPNGGRSQLMIGAGRTLSTGSLWWRGSLRGEGMAPMGLSGVNVSRATDAIVLYTPAYGPSTRTNVYGNELVVRIEPAIGVRVNSDVGVQLVELREAQGNAPIPADGAVLSGHGAGARALAGLWRNAQSGTTTQHLVLRTEVEPSVTDSVGGLPVIVRDGRRAFADAATSFVRGRHPRTLAGWSAAGDLYLISIDGRQAGYALGMSLAEAADFMIALGVVEAINLDGGGSTTFVERGSVVNRPSDRRVRRGDQTFVVQYVKPGDVVLANVERAVVNALVVVARDQAA